VTSLAPGRWAGLACRFEIRGVLLATAFNVVQQVQDFVLTQLIDGAFGHRRNFGGTALFYVGFLDLDAVAQERAGFDREPFRFQAFRAEGFVVNK
jgi:hypothetical protein